MQVRASTPRPPSCVRVCAAACTGAVLLVCVAQHTTSSPGERALSSKRQQRRTAASAKARPPVCVANALPALFDKWVGGLGWFNSTPPHTWME